MRKFTLVLLAVVASVPLLAQSPNPPMRRLPPRSQFAADNADAAVKLAIEQLTDQKKVFDRDVQVLRHIRNSDSALTDPMQPLNAIQKAYEEMDKAKLLGPEFLVMQGVLRVHRELEDARRSPATADFGRLRSILAQHAEGPAARLVIRNALRLENEILSWLKVQEQIAVHLRVLSEIAGESLRASQE